MIHNNKISVIIPAWNEAASIAKVIADIPSWVDEIIVVDNGSIDQTSQKARQAGAHVFTESQRGYGAACLKGISVLSNPNVVVFIDGDYSDFPDEMSHLVLPIIQRKVDMVIGSRVLGRREPGALVPHARYGNFLACLLMRLFWKVKYTDLGPFRAIRYSSLKALNMQDQDFGWTVEMQVKAAQMNFITTEVPVRYRKRIGKSKISGTIRGTILAGSKILTTIFRLA